MFCTECGKPNLESAQFCTDCGKSLNGGASAHAGPQNGSAGTRDQTSPRDCVYPRNPPLSPHICWVNIVLGGLAQIIYGQVAKGIVLLIATFAFGALLPVFGNVTVCIVSIIDAYMVGAALRNGRAVRKWQFFP